MRSSLSRALSVSHCYSGANCGFECFVRSHVTKIYSKRGCPVALFIVTMPLFKFFHLQVRLCVKCSTFMYIHCVVLCIDKAL